MTFLLNSHQSPHVSEKHLHTDHKQVKISKRSVVLLHRQSKDELITFIANDVHLQPECFAKNLVFYILLALNKHRFYKPPILFFITTFFKAKYSCVHRYMIVRPE